MKRSAVRRRVPLAFVSALLVGALLAPASDASNLVGRLGRGDEAFWTTPYVKRANNSQDGRRACKKGRCFVSRLEVTEPGSRLRVALDHPPDGGFLELRIVTPSGKRIEAQSRGFYSTEVFVRNPLPGTYMVEAIPRFMHRTAARLRAKLEGAARGGPRRLMLPNLRVEPPFDFAFDTSTLVLGGAVVSGVYSGSCGPDEMVEDGARRCLRMSVGPQNAGLGPLELRFSPVSDAATADAPMYQVLHYSDGSTRERRAGTFEYHKTHGHYHFKGFASLHLFKVKDPEDGGMVRVGKGRKSGFCFGDVMMNSWKHFIQAKAASSRSSCESLDEAYMGLSAGWTDIYSYDTPGNYVEFADNPDGYYVLRATVDDRDRILESHESDNVSYALIQVKGERVKVLERGHGRDPWDPHKQVVVDWVRLLRTRRN